MRDGEVDNVDGWVDHGIDVGIDGWVHNKADGGEMVKMTM